MAPCQSDSFSLQAPMFKTQLNPMVFSFGLSPSSATASEASTYLEKKRFTKNTRYCCGFSFVLPLANFPAAFSKVAFLIQLPLHYYKYFCTTICETYPNKR